MAVLGNFVSWDIFWSRSIRIFCLKKSDKKSSWRFSNYIKYSCIIFCVKMSEYSQIIYCLQEKSTNCGMKVVYVTSRIMEIVYVISRIYVLNCFKSFHIYIYFETKCFKKWDQKKFKLRQVFMCYISLNILR